MPIRKPQEMKSLNTIDLQPQNMSPKIMTIIYMDLSGKGTNAIAEELGMTAGRISIIKGSPMYERRRMEVEDELKGKYMEKQTDILTSGDPVEEVLKGAAMDAAKKKIDLMTYSGNEQIQASAAADILDRAGYKAHTERTKVSVEITEQMANRFDRILEYGSTKPNGKAKISITETVS